jgi:SAM-dependent methyltransferase
MPGIEAQLATLADGYFYHSIDLPGLPTIHGAWDLRPNVDRYLGSLDLAGKRVLEVGAANGFLSFEMERRGAQVVPYDLSPDILGDIMLPPGPARAEFEAQYRVVIGGLNRAWWHAQRAFGSALTLMHGTAYAVPGEVGEVDVTTFGSILLHLRDPYSALASAARLTRACIVVTDLFLPPFHSDSRVGRALQQLHIEPNAAARESGMIFNPSRHRDPCTWWNFSPGAIRSLLSAVGFGRARTTFHRQLFRPDFSPWGPSAIDAYGKTVESLPLFTVVAERT